MKTKTYTKIPVTTEDIKVPRVAKVTMAPKLEKKGFCEDGSKNSKARQKGDGFKAKGQENTHLYQSRDKNTEKLTDERLNTDGVSTKMSRTTVHSSQLT